MKKRIFIPAVIALLSGNPGCDRQEKQVNKRDNPENPTIAALEGRPASRVIRATGEVVPFMMWDVKPEIEGRIKKRHAKPGERVSAGDLLVEIEPPPGEEAEPSKTKVVAPSDSTVMTVPVVEGQPVVPAGIDNNGTTLMTVADLSKLVVYFHVSEADAAKLAVKQVVKVTAPSLNGDQVDSTIEHIGSKMMIKNSVRGFNVRALIKTDAAKLSPGTEVEVVIP
jgi:multidrug efflux pump subunit AcrA (membrane-fusion protein)